MRRFCTAMLAMAAGTLLATAQTVTPVDDDPNAPPRPVLHYYDKHGNPLDEPVMFLADLDTVAKAGPKPVYPLLHSVSFGANFFDAVMMAAGQKHASLDLWASLSLHNWVQPVVEAGIGFADYRPDDGNYRYKGKPSPYFKLGVDYNFLYKSNPDYQFHAGLRGGWSAFSYDITDITISSDYWQQTERFSITGQKAHALYGEVLAGLRVKVWNRISMGWDMRYRFNFKSTNGSNSTPWFVPGYGAGSALSGSFSLIYTLPLARKAPVPAEPAEGAGQE